MPEHASQVPRASADVAASRVKLRTVSDMPRRQLLHWMQVAGLSHPQRSHGHVCSWKLAGAVGEANACAATCPPRWICIRPIVSAPQLFKLPVSSSNSSTTREQPRVKVCPTPCSAHTMTCHTGQCSESVFVKSSHRFARRQALLTGLCCLLCCQVGLVQRPMSRRCPAAMQGVLDLQTGKAIADALLKVLYVERTLNRRRRPGILSDIAVPIPNTRLNVHGQRCGVWIPSGT